MDMMYRIASIFRGYKCSCFRGLGMNREFNIACMLQKGRYTTKIKFAKTFLKAFPQKFIPSKYTRYTDVRGFFSTDLTDTCRIIIIATCTRSHCTIWYIFNFSCFQGGILGNPRAPTHLHETLIVTTAT